MSVCLLFVDGYRIVDLGGDFFLRQSVDKGIAVIASQDELVIDVFCVRLFSWDGQVEAGEQLAIEVGDFSSFIIPSVEVFKFDAEDGGLYFVHPAVDSDEVVTVLAGAPVVSEHAKLFGDVVVVRDDGAGIAVCAEVLGGIKAEAANMTQRADLLALVFCAVGLRGILDNIKIVLLGQVEDCAHIGWMAVEMDGYYRLCFGGNVRFDLPGVDTVCVGVDIDKDWFGGVSGYCIDCRNKGLSNGDDFVAGSYAKGPKGQQKGVGTRINTNNVLSLNIICKFTLETLKLLAEYKRAACKHKVDRFVYLSPDG